MRDVSRGEYDAALKRVIESVGCGSCSIKELCSCTIATLAALGVDEPPTGAPLAERWPDSSVHDYRCQGECVRCWGADACGMVGQSCIPCTGSCVEKTGAVLPPSEAPKACPTCGGKNYVDIRCGDFSYDQPCPACGSGIDGGTPNNPKETT